MNAIHDNILRAGIQFWALALLLLLCWFPSHGQIDTTLRSFFPAHIGDYWEYMDDDFPMPTLHYYLKVKRDTLMPNGRTYFAFNFVEFRFPTDTNSFYYYRIDDSMRVWSYSSDTSRCPSSEYTDYQLTAADRSIWPVCFDIVPGSQQEYIGLYSTQEDFFPHLQLDTLSKLFIGPVVIDSTTGDTLWFSPFFFKDWLAKGLGIARRQGEAGPIVYLIGAIINGRRYGTITAIDESGWGQNPPAQLHLHQNFPNPFNPVTRIHYEVPHASDLSIKVYSILGQEIATLAQGLHSAGSYAVTFNASSLASGLYVYRLQTSNRILTNKMVLTK
jgi:hypothetical protein